MKIATNQERLNELFDSDARSDTAIAKELGVSKQTVSMWRHGQRSPKKSVLIQISEMFNVSIEWLMGFDVDRNGTSNRPIFLPDSGKFSKLMSYMTQEDYETVVKAFERAYKRMREFGVSLDD